jgi:hypothetical protein
VKAKRLTKQERQLFDSVRNAKPNFEIRLEKASPPSMSHSGYLEEDGSPENMAYALIQQAIGGDRSAAWRVARIATDTTAALERIALKNPELLWLVSCRQIYWPVMAQAREHQPPRVRKTFDRIRLGVATKLELDPATAKWKHDRAFEIAYQLMRYIDTSRWLPLFGGWAGPKAKKLAPFSDESAPAWWGLAREILLACYPEPEKTGVLNRLVTAKSKRKSGGRIRQAIFDVLKSRFLSIAKNTF